MRQILVVGLLVGVSAPAWPCHNGVRLRIDTDTPVVRRAEQLLSAGQPEQALDTLAELNPRRLGRALARRAFRVETVARLRMGEAALALGRLRRLRAVNGGDPYLRARHAEALAATRANDAEALRLLDDLVARDLMPDAAAWLTLARIHDRRGDGGPTEVALAKCRKLARTGESCMLEGATPSS